MSTPVLMLNADFTPIGILDWKRAFTLIFQNLDSPEIGAQVIEEYPDKVVRSAGGEEFKIPSVIRLVGYKNLKKKNVSFSRKNVYLRDEMRCQYCGKRFPKEELTYDHIVPRDFWRKNKLRGTPTYWENIVTCCYPCNNKKAQKSLEKCGLKLLTDKLKPNPAKFIPGISPWSKIPTQWIMYIKHLFPEVTENGLFKY
jgi:5-methylcytosine-specific restriction endonuclease McrA